MEDKPGGLAKVLRLLSDAGVSVEYVYAFITHEAGKAFVIIRADDNTRALEVLKANSIRFAVQSDIG